LLAALAAAKLIVPTQKQTGQRQVAVKGLNMRVSQPFGSGERHFCPPSAKQLPSLFQTHMCTDPWCGTNNTLPKAVASATVCFLSGLTQTQE
jgi:hypothetical protein